MTDAGVVVTEAEAQQAREFWIILHGDDWLTDLAKLEQATEALYHERCQQIARDAARDLDALIMGEAKTQKAEPDGD